MSKWDSIPWTTLEQHLQDSIQQVVGQLVEASDVQRVWELKGELRRLKLLLNLPGTLSVKYDKEGK